MKTIEIDLMRITGQPNVTVCVDTADYLTILNYVHNYQRIVLELETLKEQLLEAA